MEAGASDGWRGLIGDAASRLEAAGVASPRVDAELLAAHVLGRSRGDLQTALILGGPLVLPAQVQRFEALVARRVSREPLQHLTGRAAFRRIELSVGPGVFVPRPETEAVAEQAIVAARQALAVRGEARVVDLCTGSGALALAIADEVPQAQVWAVELDAVAFSWARRNVAAPRGGRAPAVVLVQADARRALAELDGTVDVVVSNPPYVPSDAVPRDREVREYDPPVALYGLGSDGLEVPRGIARAAARLLRPGGLVVIEHAEVQAVAAREMLGDEQWRAVRTERDLAGRPRMVVGERVGERHPVPDLAKDSRP